MLSTKEFISFLIHCAHSFSSISFFHIKSSFGQTLRGNKHCCIHRFPNSISQLATLPCQASSRFTMASPISPPPQLLSKKKVRFSKNGQIQKNPKHHIRSFPCQGSAVGVGAEQPDSPQQSPGPRAGEHWRARGSLLTYSVMAFFSEKILRQKSASWCGSNVVGTRM